MRAPIAYAFFTRDLQFPACLCVRFLFPYRGSVDIEIPVRILVFIQVKIDGTMSDIGFTTTGSPLSVEYDIVNQGRNGFVKVSMIHAPTSRANLGGRICSCLHVDIFH